MKWSLATGGSALALVVGSVPAMAQMGHVDSWNILQKGDHSNDCMMVAETPDHKYGLAILLGRVHGQRGDTTVLIPSGGSIRGLHFDIDITGMMDGFDNIEGCFGGLPTG
jgi:hypothetical protein